MKKDRVLVSTISRVLVPVIALDGVTSSQIHSVGYSPGDQILAMRFIQGDGTSDEYQYKNVPPEEFARFMSAPSLGSYHSRNIKNNPAYPCLRVLDGPMDDVYA